MSKEITCEVLKEYCEVDVGEKMSTKLCEVKWNGRPCNGVDIRKYDKDTGSLYKGITISYDGFTELVKSAIANNLVKASDVEEALGMQKKRNFSTDDIQSILHRMNQEDEEYRRTRKGLLMDRNNCVVVTRRGLK